MRSEVLFSLLFFNSLFAGVKMLQQQAAQAYVASKSLSAIKKDLEQQAFNQELQELLVPLIISKYSKYYNCNVKLSKQLKVDPLNYKLLVPVVMSPNNKYLVTGSQDTIARLWDVETGEVVKILKGHTGAIRSVAFNADSTQVLTGSTDGTARLWDISTSNTLQVFKNHNYYVTAVAFSRCGGYALTGSGSIAYLWNTTTGKLARAFEGNDGLIRVALFNTDATQIATGHAESAVCVWDTTTGQLIKKISVAHTVGAVAFSQDSMHVLFGTLLDGKIFLWDSVTDRISTVFDNTKWYDYLSPRLALSMTFNQNYTRVIIGYHNGNVCVVDLEAANSIHSMHIPVAPGYSHILSVAISSHGKYIVTCNYDTAFVWDVGYSTTMQLSEILDMFICSGDLLFRLKNSCTVV